MNEILTPMPEASGMAGAARYDMPAMFGPSLLPDQSPVEGVTVAAISFETSRDAAQALLPRFYEVADTPIVTLTYIDYPALEYLGGRGYRELVVAVASVYPDAAGDLKAGFAPVMWVDQVGALISGREYMGFGKLLGEFAAERAEDRISYICSEYGTPLIEGEAYDLSPVSADGLARINMASAEVNSFGWKYIASDHGPADADYPLVNVTRWDYKRAWSGTGSLRFHAASRSQAPMSSRVVAALAGLPMLGYRRAFVAEGDVVIDRRATRRLDRAADL